MTSPVYMPPPPKRRRSSLKRQQRATVITVAVVLLLAIAFSFVYYFTSRTVFRDWDDTKYYILQRDGTYVMEDTDGNRLPTTEDGNYKTPLGTIVMLDKDTGKHSVIAAVNTSGTETLKFSSYNGQFDVLLYPILEREDIHSIHVHNVKRDENGAVLKENDFTFLHLDDDTFEIDGYTGVGYDQTMFATLVVCTGYTVTYMRLDLEKVREYGYAEYGLPEDTATADNYFEITSRDGTTHKVIIGDEITAGSGYYARYVGRDEVYVLKELTASDYNATLSQVLFSTVEDYTTPMALVPMGSTSYFDVTDFTLSKIPTLSKEQLDSIAGSEDLAALLSEVVNFSYEPIEKRKGTFLAHTPYWGEDAFADFRLNDFRIDDCLQNLQNLSFIRTVELLTNEQNGVAEGETEEEIANNLSKGFLHFIEKYGIAYCIEFTYNAARDKALTPTEYYEQMVWISPMTEDGTYYMYNWAFQMIVEVSRSSLEFLEWTSFDWIEADVLSENLVYVDKMEITVPGGTASGGTSFVFDVNNSQSLVEWNPDKESNIPSGNLLVYCNGEAVNVDQFKKFYQTLIYTSLGGMANCSEAEQEAFRDAFRNEGYKTDAGDSPLLVITITYNTNPTMDGKTITRTFAFYSYGGGYRAFATCNGNGSYYLLQNRVFKIIADIDRIFTGEAINPEGKT